MAAGEVVGNPRHHQVRALACRFQHHIGAVVDHIGVVSRSAHEAVRCRAAQKTVVSSSTCEGHPDCHFAGIERVVACATGEVRESRRLCVGSQNHRVSQLRKRDVLDAVKFAEIRIGESRCRLEGEGVGSRTTVESDAADRDSVLLNTS